LDPPTLADCHLALHPDTPALPLTNCEITLDIAEEQNGLVMRLRFCQPLFTPERSSQFTSILLMNINRVAHHHYRLLS
jgi:hypothetical protein